MPAPAWLPTDPYERLMRRVEVTDGCWLWTGPVSTSGYSYLSFNAAPTIYGHRLAYEHHKGPIPDGLTVDHLCGVKRCVNPDHLEAITVGENTRRYQRAHGVPAANSDTCRKGLHPWPESRNSQGCGPCAAERKRRARRSEAIEAAEVHS